MASLEAKKHIDTLDTLDHEHARSLYKAQESILEDPDLDELTKWVLGITGSEKELDRYQTLAEKVGKLIGQPIIALTNVSAGIVSEPRLLYSMGGLISGELTVYRGGRPHEWGVQLNVPVDPFISARHQNGFTIDHSHGAVLQNTVTVAHLKPRLTEREGKKIKLGWRNAVEHPVLVGRFEIYHSDFWNGGVLETLGAIEVTAKAK